MIDGFYGYLNAQSVPTTRVAALRICQQSPIVRNNVSVVDLLYEMKESIKWEIPETLTHLRISFGN